MEVDLERPCGERGTRQRDGIEHVAQEPAVVHLDALEPIWIALGELRNPGEALGMGLEGKALLEERVGSVACGARFGNLALKRGDLCDLLTARRNERAGFCKLLWRDRRHGTKVRWT